MLGFAQELRRFVGCVQIMHVLWRLLIFDDYAMNYIEHWMCMMILMSMTVNYDYCLYL